MDQAYASAPIQTGALEAIDKGLIGLSDAIDSLGERLHPVSRFDTPDSGELAMVRSEPPNPLRSFEERIADMTARVHAIRNRLDI